MKTIVWSIMSIPAEIVAVCKECRYELARVSYFGYEDCNDKLKELKSQLLKCPKCKINFSCRNTL